MSYVILRILKQLRYDHRSNPNYTPPVNENQIEPNFRFCLFKLARNLFSLWQRTFHRSHCKSPNVPSSNIFVLFLWRRFFPSSFFRSTCGVTQLPTFKPFISQTYTFNSLTWMSTYYYLSRTKFHFITQHVPIFTFPHLHVHSSYRHHESYFCKLNHVFTIFLLRQFDRQIGTYIYEKLHYIPICLFPYLHVHSNQLHHAPYFSTARRCLNNLPTFEIWVKKQDLQVRKTEEHN